MDSDDQSQEYPPAQNVDLLFNGKASHGQIKGNDAEGKVVILPNLNFKSSFEDVSHKYREVLNLTRKFGKATLNEEYLPIDLLALDPILTYSGMVRSKEISNPTVIRTKLQEFFHMNATNRDVRSMNLLYENFPKYFVWDKQDAQWENKKKGNHIGRLDQINPLEERDIIYLYCYNMLQLQLPTKICDQSMEYYMTVLRKRHFTGDCFKQKWTCTNI